MTEALGVGNFIHPSVKSAIHLPSGGRLHGWRLSLAQPVILHWLAADSFLIMIKTIEKENTWQTMIATWLYFHNWLLGRVAWFSIRVWEIPGSIPRAAPLSTCRCRLAFNVSFENELSWFVNTKEYDEEMKLKSTHRGDRSHNHKVKSLALCRLS